MNGFEKVIDRISIQVRFSPNSVVDTSFDVHLSGHFLSDEILRG
jgi:hypothetical protein